MLGDSRQSKKSIADQTNKRPCKIKFNIKMFTKRNHVETDYANAPKAQILF